MPRGGSHPTLEAHISVHNWDFVHGAIYRYFKGLSMDIKKDLTLEKE